MKKYLNKEFLLSNKQLVIKATAIIVILAVAFFVFLAGDGEQDVGEDILVSSGQEVSLESEPQSAESESASIIVDVGGAIQAPQVVELRSGSRVADAISAAGGLRKDADTAGINQAALLTDGEKVYIPKKGETAASALEPLQPQEAADSGFSAKVNINTATSEELQTLDGVGPVTAEKILSYRNSNGAFQNIEEIKNVDGIGDKTFENLKEHITV